jgi:hypothetical protein
MDQRRVCQMMLIGPKPRPLDGQRAGEMEAEILLHWIGRIGALLGKLFFESAGKVLGGFGLGFGFVRLWRLWR